MFKLSSDVLPTDPRRGFCVAPFFIGVSCLSLLRCLVCSLRPYDHLLGKCWPLVHIVRCVLVCFCHFNTVLIHIRLRVRVVSLIMFKPSGYFLTDRSKAVLLLWILFYLYFVSVFAILSCLFLTSLYYDRLLGKGWPLGSHGYYVFLWFVIFSYGVLGRVWYLIVSNPDLYIISYFEIK